MSYSSVYLLCHMRYYTDEYDPIMHLAEVMHYMPQIYPYMT
jgi:hypothetical protein